MEDKKILYSSEHDLAISILGIDYAAAVWPPSLPFHVHFPWWVLYFSKVPIGTGFCVGVTSALFVGSMYSKMVESASAFNKKNKD